MRGVDGPLFYMGSRATPVGRCEHGRQVSQMDLRPIAGAKAPLSVRTFAYGAGLRGYVDNDGGTNDSCYVAGVYVINDQGLEDPIPIAPQDIPQMHPRASI